MNATIHTRSPQLSPLSREHQEGMAFVERISQSIGKVSLYRLTESTRWYWKNHIRPHFYQEEQILLPYLPADHPLAKKLKDDHAYIRDLILWLDHEADEQAFKCLCDQLATHIRFEEEQVFAYLEQRLSEEELNNIYLDLQGHPVSAEEWDDVFWK